ncbi:hypothetical protein TTHERM_00895690 (macronuclear) [Tetrahymena thermophila SB210]|uniref:Transmembrane protein n=1 Tax=Tetrahymena thermophila (strain SB210) TaxID=312017 RepID=Q22E58_TETTS|nr:hypothetical protein TTHERM_00895690 [Tetrahymena thermophila SB210]EAR83556.1 hypothetical protein TTHERM_00895690 [Tetrahymena thermophila SB210]|eukprot:XP_001031219.1 hypothetical protein TTHERM_00895690 [Tetrahymena thermophila SB210]
MRKISFELSILLLVLACSCNCQYIFNNCTDINEYEVCQQYKSCQWVKKPEYNFCYSACYATKFQQECVANSLCTWVNQQPAQCISNPLSCPANASDQGCNADYCTFTPQKCSAQPEKCPSFTTAESCGTTQCTWQVSNTCIYNQASNQCANLIGDQCAGPYCQSVQKCVNKTQKQMRGSLISDVDCSSFNPQDCASHPECEISTSCVGVTTQDQGCSLSKDQNSCSTGQSANFCTWLSGTCNTNQAYCTSNCDLEYCKVDQPSNCKINPKSTTCSSQSRQSCTTGVNYNFCLVQEIVPAVCKPKEEICSFSQSEDSCQTTPFGCLYRQVGVCTFVSEVQQSANSRVLIYSFTLLAFLQIIF